MLALIFPQLWQTVSKSFLILVKKPVDGSQSNQLSCITAGTPRTDVKDWRRELNVTEVSGTLLRSLLASLAIVLTVDGA